MTKLKNIDDRSIVRIRAIDDKIRYSGTGFIILSEEKYSIVITCAHVITEVDPEDSRKVKVEGIDGKVICIGAKDNIDIAIIKTASGLQGNPFLISKKDDSIGSKILTKGWIKHIKEKDAFQLLLTELEGEIKKKIQLGGKGIEQRIVGWDFEIINNENSTSLEKGLSGSPIIDSGTFKVIGIISSMSSIEGKGNSLKGQAVAIEELENMGWDIPKYIEAQLDSIADPQPKPKIKTEFEFVNKVHAFLVGINNYEHGKNSGGKTIRLDEKEFANLEFCEEDISKFSKFISQHQNDAKQIKILGKDATREAIHDKLEEFVKEVNAEKEDSLVFVFFACHGYQYSSDNYIIPYDARRNRKHDSISYNDISDYMNMIKTPSKILLLDCCRSGEWAESGERGILDYDQIGNFKKDSSYHIIASCKSDQNSQEVGGNGIFTNALLQLFCNSNEFANPDITTKNILIPLKNKVNEIVNENEKKNQIPISNIAEFKKEIIIGKNIKKEKEIKVRKEGKKEKQLFLYNRIKDFKLIKDHPLTELCCMILDSYIKFKPNLKYKKFFEKFDRCSEDFNDNIDNEDVSAIAFSLFSKFEECRNRKLEDRNEPEKTPDEQSVVSTIVRAEKTEDLTKKESIQRLELVSFRDSRRIGNESISKVSNEEKRKFSKEQINGIINELLIAKLTFQAYNINNILKVEVSIIEFFNLIEKLEVEAEKEDKEKYLDFKIQVKNVMNKFSIEWGKASKIKVCNVIDSRLHFNSFNK